MLNRGAMMFIGREDLLEKLKRLWQKNVPSLVTCRGRRRIGKSTLIREFAARTANHFISLEGQAPGAGINGTTQLTSFAEQLSIQTNSPNLVPQNWLQAFQMLDNALPKSGKTVLLLDEISWMGAYDATFPSTLKIAWDKMFSRHESLIVVLCGSVSSWISKNILQGTGFVGRASLDLVVGELPLKDCFSFWRSSAKRVSLQEKLDLLSITGGVPKYLEELNPALSTDENIRALCFSPEGLLFRDFNQIFHEVFGNRSTIRKDILKALSNGPLTVTALAEALGKETSGHLSDYLEELELSGFIAKDMWINPRTKKPALMARYRLKDNYARFYLHYIEPRNHEVENGLYQFTSLENLPGWQTILGLQFENMVVGNFQLLLPKIGLNGVSLLSASPYYSAPTKGREGCQIDLLIQSRKALYVVEMKRKSEIGMEAVREMEHKVEQLSVPRGMSVRTVLVYDGHLAPKVQADGSFDFAIPVEELFK